MSTDVGVQVSSLAPKENLSFSAGSFFIPRTVNGMFFEYGKTEINYLRQKDKRLREVIDRIGHVERAVDADLLSSVVYHIICL